MHKISLINSGVNSEILIPRPELRPQEYIHVIYPASHLGIRKGLFRVLQAWEKVEKTGLPIKLVIIGGVDAFKKDLENWVQNHPSTSFLGWVESHTEKYRNLLQSSHIIINPSFEEGQVGCVLEAMSTGAVPIITDNCGVNIENGVEGYIVNPEDTDELARQIISLSNNKTLREKISQEAIAVIHRNHSWETFRQNIKRILIS